MSSRSSHRPLIFSVLALCLLAGAIVAVAVVYDHGHQDRLAAGIRIGGVDVGGLNVDAARSRVEARALAPRRRALHVQAAGKMFTLTPAQTRVTADVERALTRAHRDSRRGWLGARVAHGLSGRRVDERIGLTVHYARGVVPALVARAEKAVAKPAVDAKVEPAADGLNRVPSHDGRALDVSSLQRRLVAALRFASRPATITAPTKPVPAKVTTSDLADKYPSYVVINRKAHELRFYRHLELAHTYPIAVGKSGLETPAGLYDVQWKEVNPPWRVPNSAWAGALAGRTIPPGPQDPIKARWMAFNGGAGIHGIDPSEYGSIGHDASHGCVRMRIPDVISLYAKTPVGTPVFVS